MPAVFSENSFLGNKTGNTIDQIFSFLKITKAAASNKARTITDARLSVKIYILSISEYTEIRRAFL